MRRAFALPVLALTLLLPGCKANSIEGKWNATGAEGQGLGTTATFDFAGGQLTMSLDAKLPQIGDVVATVKGPYRLQGETLTFDATTIDIDESKLTPMGRAFASNPKFRDGLEKSLKENREYKVKFDSSDQVLLTGTKGSPTTLKRVK